DYKKRPTVKSLLETETMQLVGMTEKSKEQKGSEFENEQINKKMNELEMKVRSLEVENSKEKQEKIKAITENDKLKQEKMNALNERDQIIEERNQLQNDNERALAERDRERIEKDQQKRRADTTQSELDKQKTKTNESQELVRAFQQQVETTHSDNIRLTTENQHLKAELSKLRPLTTSSKQQSKPEPKLQQIQQTVPPSLNPNMLIGIIPNKEYVYQQGVKIIRTDKQGNSTVAFNPIISSGIVRFGGFFERHSDSDFSIGIADSSAVFGSNEGPFEGQNDKKTVCYWNEFTFKKQTPPLISIDLRIFNVHLQQEFRMEKYLNGEKNGKDE
ncbi:MAG: hypothetical protein EZS28_031097, partial [Streblomastix strix]